jgi:hypothetical protein
MPTTTRPSSTRSPSSARLVWLDPAEIAPNPWNPNVVPADVLDKVREALHRFGWLAPVVVRSVPGGYQLVDGEHRWQVAREDGLNPIPAFVVDGLSEVEAKRATVILNDLHGQARPDRLAALVADVLTEIDLPELLVGFPYSEDALSALGPLPSVTVGPLPNDPSPAGARWVERTYRLPPDAAEVLDEALAKAKGQDDIETWQALERISAEFLASA